MQTAHLLRFRAQRKADAAKKQTLISTENKKSVKSVAPKKAAAKKSEKSVKSVAPKKTASKKRTK